MLQKKKKKQFSLLVRFPRYRFWQHMCSSLLKFVNLVQPLAYVWAGTLHFTCFECVAAADAMYEKPQPGLSLYPHLKSGTYIHVASKHNWNSEGLVWSCGETRSFFHFSHNLIAILRILFMEMYRGAHPSPHTKPVSRKLTKH